MLKKIKLLFMFLIIGIFILSSNVIAEEDCHIQLQISESIEENGVSFSLVSSSKVFGDYENLISYYGDEGDSLYSLNVYDSGGRVIGKYSADSSSVTWVEKAVMDEDGNVRYFGDVIFDDSGIIESFVPCDSNLDKITMEFDGKETDLGFDLNNLGDKGDIQIEEGIGGEVVGYVLSGAGEPGVEGEYLNKGSIVNGKKVFVNSLDSTKQISFDGTKWVVIDMSQPMAFFMNRYSVLDNGQDIPPEGNWIVERGTAPAPGGEYVYSDVQLSPLEKGKEVIIAVMVIVVLFLIWWFWKRRSKNV